MNGSRRGDAGAGEVITMTPMSRAEPPPRSPLRRLLKVLSAVVLVFVLAIGVTMFVSWRKANQPPEWWRPVNPADPQVDQAARSVENRVSDQLHRVRPAAPDPASPQTWTMTIKGEDANAWLGARLKEWLQNRSERIAWPANASEPQVSFQDGVIELGFEVSPSPGEKGRVISLGLEPRVDAQGLWVPLDTFGIGRLMLSGGAMADAGRSMLESRLPASLQNNPDTKNFIEALSGKRPLVKDAVMKLSDGRRVQIVRITPKPGELELECRTLPRQ